MENAAHEMRPPRRREGLVPLVGLRECQCKWPAKYDARVIGGFLFCGRSTDGQSYCAKHQALTCVRQRGRERTKPA